MSTHSPGPWIWTRNGRLVDATGKPMVGWCLREPVDESYVVTPADPDRRLIAEAPAMLELLKTVASWGTDCRTSPACGKCFHCQLRATLRRIEGEP